MCQTSQAPQEQPTEQQAAGQSQDASLFVLVIISIPYPVRPSDGRQRMKGIIFREFMTFAEQRLWER
jgi:hypothetical protein